MEISFAKNTDIPGILDLLIQVGQVHHAGRPDLFREDARKYDERALRALLTDTSRPIFVARDGEKVLGYAFCIRQSVENDPVLQDTRELYIDDLCVDSAIRAKGIGTALFAAVKAYAREQGIDRITLNVWAFNEPAMAFYRKCGMLPRKIVMEKSVED